MKDCTPSQIRNPATNRCVKRSGSIGRKLQARPCSPNQIRNPATNRCVKKDGAIGKKIMMGKQKTPPRPKSLVKKLLDKFEARDILSYDSKIDINTLVKNGVPNDIYGILQSMYEKDAGESISKGQVGKENLAFFVENHDPPYNSLKEFESHLSGPSKFSKNTKMYFKNFINSLHKAEE